MERHRLNQLRNINNKEDPRGPRLILTNIFIFVLSDHVWAMLSWAKVRRSRVSVHVFVSLLLSYVRILYRAVNNESVECGSLGEGHLK